MTSKKWCSAAHESVCAFSNFFGLLVLAKATQKFDLAGMFAGKLTEAAAGSHGLIYSALLLVMVSWFILLLVENCRVPFDDPNTHLELTMIHEVMILDHGGPVLGLLLYGASIKLFLYATLIVRAAIPFPNDAALPLGGVFLNWGLFLAGIFVVAVLIGVIESIMARLKMTEVPKLLATACVLSALGLILLL